MGFFRLLLLLGGGAWRLFLALAVIIGVVTEWPQFEAQYGVRPYLDEFYAKASYILENYPLGIFLSICFIAFLLYFVGVEPKGRSKEEFERRRKPRTNRPKGNGGSKKRKRRK
ncbi:MAG: hypothetical protein Q7S99_09150 [Parvibaculum sp.]|nr:hypothetical protein [Parvibaculum sp.]